MTRADVALWRIAKHTADYAATDLSGGGARACGGRWNGKGVPMVYAATTIALATLETLAHLGENIAIRNAFLVRIDVPAQVWKSRQTITAGELPPTWLAEPPGSTSIDAGNAWLASRACALLLVPSVIVPEEYNVLINPLHPLANKLTASVVRQYVYDPRL
ncbi:RES family NAD+ phosphorylase [Oxalobacteraceae bacterium OTU3CINTB1]|nr:RES family NAD+ phosphorylase [Oxalobacteraceae bacterium OTU3CINTB1]